MSLVSLYQQLVAKADGDHGLHGVRSWRGLRATRGDIERLRRTHPQAFEDLRHANARAGMEGA